MTHPQASVSKDDLYNCRKSPNVWWRSAKPFLRYLAKTFKGSHFEPPPPPAVKIRLIRSEFVSILKLTIVIGPWSCRKSFGKLMKFCSKPILVRMKKTRHKISHIFCEFSVKLGSYAIKLQLCNLAMWNWKNLIITRRSTPVNTNYLPLVGIDNREKSPLSKGYNSAIISQF